MERTNEWLAHRLDHIWQTFFADVIRANQVTIRFGRTARSRLGSIRRRHSGETIITITGLFHDPSIPEVVINETISH